MSTPDISQGVGTKVVVLSSTHAQNDMVGQEGKLWVCRPQGPLNVRGCTLYTVCRDVRTTYANKRHVQRSHKNGGLYNVRLLMTEVEH